MNSESRVITTYWRFCDGTFCFFTLTGNSLQWRWASHPSLSLYQLTRGLFPLSTNVTVATNGNTMWLYQKPEVSNKETVWAKLVWSQACNWNTREKNPSLPSLSTSLYLWWVITTESENRNLVSLHNNRKYRSNVFDQYVTETYCMYINLDPIGTVLHFIGQTLGNSIPYS